MTIPSPRMLAYAALVALLAGCSGNTSSGLSDSPAQTRPSGAALLQQVRGAGEVGDELDVQPLRDPRVEDLRHAATRLLEQAAQYTPDDPDLLQWQAEMALVARDWSKAEQLATQSWDRGPKLGGLCRRNWTTRKLAAEARGDAAAAALAEGQVAGCKVAPPVRL